MKEETEKTLLEQVNLLARRGNKESLLYVHDVKEFARKIVADVMPWESSISIYKGLKVVEKDWMPKGKAAMVDTSGKVLTIFDL